MHEYLPKEVEVALYIDNDVMFINTPRGFSEPIAALKAHKTAILACASEIDGPRRVNNGISLWHLQRARSIDWTRVIQQTLGPRSKPLRYADQSVLDYIARGRLKVDQPEYVMPLSPKYHHQAHKRDTGRNRSGYKEQNRYLPAAVHFIGFSVQKSLTTPWATTIARGYLEIPWLAIREGLCGGPYYNSSAPNENP